MTGFRIHTLGCGSAKPTLRHQPSSTVVEHNDNLYMVDCGEGAQLAFQRQHLKFSRLRHIFLTHLHGDHVLGLPGLVSSLALGSAGGSITVHTFTEGKKILQKIFNFFAGDLPFNVEFNIIKPEEAVILETPSLTVRIVPLNHRVPTVGYIFEEKPKLRHIKRDMIDFHQVPVSQIRLIKAGADYIKPDGSVIENKLLTTDPTPALSYAHISDTAYMPDLAHKIGPVDLLFHETTYTEAHLSEAAPRGHSTARQAATVAKESGAKCLLTGHYSSRYKDDSVFLKEAQEVFPNVILNREGLITSLPVQL
ncbi:MAG: ribonuclease Z [Muribaculaceae bacterium]|nr:ribonuclease Z [Muribaculaceae bacterium]